MKLLGHQILTLSIGPGNAPTWLRHGLPILLDRFDRSVPGEEGLDRVVGTRSRIGLLHHVGGGNLGDDATLAAVADNIRRRWPNAEIVALSMNPDETERRHGIKSYALRRNRWAIGYGTAGTTGLKARAKALAWKYWPSLYVLNAIKAAVRLPISTFGELYFLVSSRRILKSIELLIICGGGQLTEKDGPWGFPYTIFKWVVLARSAGANCLVLNVGAGPLTRTLSKFFARQVLRAADYVSLRDDQSLALVREIGFTGESWVRPDSAYGLEFAAAKTDVRERSCRSVVGVAPMPYPDPDPTTGRLTERDRVIYETFIGKLAGFAARLVSQSYELAFFGTDIGVYPSAIEDLQRALLSHHGVRPSPCRVYHSITSVHDLLATISGMDYVVTCRFHGVVFAHLLNKPILAIAPHPKVTELMAALELQDYCMDIRNFDADLLTERFTSMVNNAERIKDRMATKLARNRHLLSSQFDELFDLRSARKWAQGPRIGKGR